MGIWSGIKEDAAKIKADYEAAVGGVGAVADSVVADVKDAEQRVVEVVESLEAQALGEVDAFANTSRKALTKLQEYESRLQKSIAAKSNALTKVQDAIGRLQSVTPSADTSPSTEGAQPAPAV